MISRLLTGARFAAAGLAMAAALAPLATQAEDNSVKRKLDKLGQKYEVDSDGDFKLTFRFKEDGRTQLIFVSGTAEELKPLMIRQVFSPVAKVGEDGVAGKAMELLQENFTFKIGGFEVQGDFLIFNIKIHDGASPDELMKAISMAGIVADEKEKELSGDRDTF